MITSPQRTDVMTVNEFDQWVMLPENVGKDYEYIGGRIVEVTSNGLSSEVAYAIGSEIRNFVRKRKLGRITGADGGFHIGGERYIPDVAFISAARQPKASLKGYNPNPPDLAVEVLSPSNSDEEIRIKVTNYLSVGTVAWVLNPFRPRVEVYIPGQPVRILGMEDTLEGGTVLPGFSIPVRELFEALDDLPVEGDEQTGITDTPDA